MQTGWIHGFTHTEPTRIEGWAPYYNHSLTNCAFKH